MAQFILILFGVGFMLPMLVVIFSNDEDFIAEVVGMYLAMLFIIGLMFFIQGVIW